MSLDNLSIESTSPDGLWGTRWSFLLLNDTLVVNEYITWSRPSKRHKEVVTAQWSRLNSRNSTLKQADVPFNPAIAAWATREFIKLVESKLKVAFQTALQGTV